jgi:hypothetical protein
LFSKPNAEPEVTMGPAESNISDADDQLKQAAVHNLTMSIVLIS